MVDFLQAPLSRRRFLALGAASGAGLLLAACGREPTTVPVVDAHLTARPGTPAGSVTAGQHPLGLATGRDGLLYVPASYTPDQPATLVVMLHGAGRSSTEALALLQPYADSAGLVVLAPDSRDVTWDLLHFGAFGDDVAFIDAALASVFAKVAVDPARVALAGFSDGASYALSLGLTNGDLFSRLVAFSPGLAAPQVLRGRPRIFDSHGTQDTVLLIERTSRVIVPALRNAGYDVTYEEFDGGHTVPSQILTDAVQWLTTAAPAL